MYIAMNRFRVVPGQNEAFETIWRNRDSRLAEMPGFVSFAMLRGPQTETHTLYASHTVWADEASFKAWTRSEQFRASHRGAGGVTGIYLGPPEFEGFSAVEGI